MFEFVRNAVFDARNFFDRKSPAQPGRLPPFARNEFGFANGGPLVLPRLYDGRNRTYYFGQYQGFRQVLGTTQVLPVPTLEERARTQVTAFPGDVLTVPVDPGIASVLAGYPMPNDRQGPFGARTYATSSKVHTVTDQFSVRIDHQVSANGRLFGRFNLNNVDGPLTNPSQTAIDPSFAIRFFDHQRNAGIGYTYTPSATFISETMLGYTRSTPNFPTINRTQPGLTFADGLYEAFNTPSGSVIGVFGNMYQARQTLTWTRKSHVWKAGAEVRVNVDSTIFGPNPNGTYSFGGGVAYSPVEIQSRSGLHDVHIGDPLPDALSGFLTASPFSYTVSAAPPIFAQGERIGDSAVRRQAYNFFFQDTWKVTPRLAISYGLRYEYNTPIREAALRSSATVFEDASGNQVDSRAPGARVRYLVNTEPTYNNDRNGWGPRLALDWRVTDKTTIRAGGAITTMLTNLFQCNFVTGGMPYVVTPYLTAVPGAPVPFSNSAVAVPLPDFYTPAGDLVYATGKSTDVPPNTEMDIPRFERDLAALSPDKQVRPVTGAGMDPNFRNGYIASYMAGVEHSFNDVTVNVRICRHCRYQAGPHRLSQCLWRSRSVLRPVLGV